jgi:glutamyl-tRNA synthetase
MRPARPRHSKQAIYRDLDWLGIAHDLTDRQLGRLKVYSTAFYRLQASGRVYPCYETEAELERQRALLKMRKLPPIYEPCRAEADGCRARAKLEAEGRKPHWRFKLSRQKVALDAIWCAGRWRSTPRPCPIRCWCAKTARFSTPCRRWPTTLISPSRHVVRGEDHVTNTAAQIEIFQALDATVPGFAHFPLLVGAGGEALSKRLGSLSLESLREDGMEPMAVAAYLAKIGTSDAIEPRLSLDELAREFDFVKIGRAPAHFDPEELKALNARTLHLLPYDAARLEPMGISESLWNAIRPNLTRIADAESLARLVTGPVTPVIEDAGLAAKAATLLPPEPWDEATWGAWTGAVSAETGARGRGLFHPLRLALTGRGDGPELKKLLPLIGRSQGSGPA